MVAAVGSVGALVVPTSVSAEEARLGPIDPGSRLVEFDLPNTSSLPTDIEAGADGSVWVSMFAEKAVVHLDRDGRLIAKAPLTGMVTSLATDHEGGVWGVELLANYIVHVTADHLAIEYTLRPDGAFPTGIWDGGDQVYFTQPGAGGIGILTESTGTITEHPIAGSVTPSGISGLDDQVWVTDPNAERVWMLDRAGAVLPGGPRSEAYLEARLTGIESGQPKAIYYTERSAGLVTSASRTALFNARGSLKGIVQIGGTFWSADAVSNTILYLGSRNWGEYVLPSPNSGITALTVTEGRFLWALEKRTGRLARLDTLVGVEMMRKGGTDRYEAASVIGEDDLAASGTAYLVSGEKFADALSAGATAAAEGAPILLTRGTELPAVVRAQLSRLKPRKIVVVGGPSSVSEGVLAAVRAAVPGADLTRVSGADRYEVSRTLVRSMDLPDGDVGLYLANGQNYPDALSSTPAAVHLGTGVLLIDGSKPLLSDADLAIVKSRVTRGKYVKIVGGELSVSSGIEAQLRGVVLVQRIAGPDRYAVSAAVNEDAFDEAGLHSLSPSSGSSAYLASGENFPDALAGGAAAAISDSPLFLARRACVPEAALERIASQGVELGVILGGVNTLSERIESLTSCG
ncbi:cell wall-binding repeat-containing protein [Herbiconiux moechotypicola]|uniref:cell wall-binding repeat-containing protein n=1 Tax=Herbiconiux moechotypicola TaxID=637393 RepID=UPI00217F1433|nr:cell wall-binding repeat-containing protein [Herbiconiux moechotypicola]MCS5729037.1 cell wall-binding repeat-containing protein [Herbiconiux moechotypicola]